MFSAIVVVFLSVVLFVYNYKLKRRNYVEAINKFNGPPTVPILGNVLDVLGPPKSK